MKDDRLTLMFKKQKEFNQKLYPDLYKDNCPIEDKERISKDMAFSAIRELTELIDETNWKKHQLIHKEVNLSNILEEAIDVLKFYLNILNIWGFTDQELYEEFIRKSAVVEQKWKQEQMLSTISESDRVVCIDIDNVLGDYTNFFLKFAYNWLVSEHLENVFPSVSHILSISYLIQKIGRETYNKIKRDYRISGVKQDMPLNPNAKELLDSLHNLGFKIILLTARPYKQYNRIWADTLDWLKKNNLYFDAILFDRDKEDLVVKLFPNMEYFIDDDKQNIKRVAECGFKCFYFGSHIEIEEMLRNMDNVRCHYSLNQIQREIENENNSIR